MITINFIKAQEITKASLRVERKPLLELLDIQTMQNISNSVAVAEIEARKQALRDVTLLADNATTLEELKALKAEHNGW